MVGRDLCYESLMLLLAYVAFIIYSTVKDIVDSGDGVSFFLFFSTRDWFTFNINTIVSKSRYTDYKLHVQMYDEHPQVYQ